MGNSDTIWFLINFNKKFRVLPVKIKEVAFYLKSY